MSSPSFALGSLQWREHWSRGTRTWMVHEPLSSQHFLFTELHRTIWLHLQSGLSLAQITQTLQTQFPDQPVRSEDVAALVSDLQAAGLCPVMQWGNGLARYQQASRKKSVQYHSWWSPWTVRVPLLDPSPWLAPLGGLVWLVFHPIVAMAVMLMGTAMTMHALGAMAAGLVDWSHMKHPGVWMGATLGLVIAKSCHELGHALACRRYKVECHEIGLLWLFMLPCLYCDVSDSWRLESRRQRMVIALAGIYLEWMIAILAYGAWTWAVPGTFKSVMLITAIASSLGTLIINANPLLRYDGYFVLSDVIDWPNLWQDASQAWRKVLAWCWGIAQPVPFSAGQGAILVIYALFSMAYRWLLTISLIIVVQTLFPVRETPMITMLLMAGLLMPWLAGVISNLRTLSTGRKQPWLVRWCKRLVILALLAVAAYAWATVPLETRLSARATCRAGLVPIYAPASGFIVTMKADGSAIEPGETIVQLRDPHKEQLWQKLQLEVDVLSASYERLKDQEASDATIAQTLPTMRSVWAGKQEQLQILKGELDRLQIRAPQYKDPLTIGSWSSEPNAGFKPRASAFQSHTFHEVRYPKPTYALGAAVDKGALLGQIKTNVPPIVEAYIREDKLDMLDLTQPVRLRLDCQPDKEWDAEVVEVLPAAYANAHLDWPSQDGLLPVVQRDGRNELAIPHLVVRLKPASQMHMLLHENWATVHFATRAQTCHERCLRWLQTTFFLGVH